MTAPTPLGKKVVWVQIHSVGQETRGCPVGLPDYSGEGDSKIIW